MQIMGNTDYGLIEKITGFISWCIEEYAVENSVNAAEVGKSFSADGVTDFLATHYGILHTQGREYILETIGDYIKKGR